jgi:hypothetical protein
MEQKQASQKWIRGSVVVFIGLLLLAGTLPNTGGIMEGAPRHGMWRCGPFLFYPDAFFEVVGVVAAAAACTLFGIVRGNVFEIVGWILLGILLICIVMQ